MREVEGKKYPVGCQNELEIKEAVEILLGKMTLAQKLGQMSQSVGADISAIGTTKTVASPEEIIREGKAGSMIQVGEPHEMAERIRRYQKIAVEESELGIPLMFCQDVIHGFETVFPIPLAWSCSFEPERIKEAVRTSAREAGVSGIMYAYSPMVDISRDPRWGRVAEGAGEDPYLGACIARAQVEGMQAEGPEDKGMIACLKHFLGYGAAEAGRDYNTVELSETTMKNTYLPPFKAGIEAGAKSIMTAFNVMNGVPMVANRPLMEGLLRDELGFDGLVISDYGAVMELMAHGYAEDEKDAAKKAALATLDIEMTTTYYKEFMEELIAEGKVDEKVIDDAVRRILTAKYRLGIMDDPYRFLEEDRIDEIVFCKKHREQSKELAKHSCVLLKNNGILPLDKDAKDTKIALIGPFADSTDLSGSWSFSTRRGETVTIAQGFRNQGFECEVEAGSGVLDPVEGGVERAIALAKKSDIVILALGESSVIHGEACSRMDITIPKPQDALAKAVAATGKPVILVVTNGRPLLLDWYDKNMDAVLECWAPGTEAGDAVAELLFGVESPNGKLTMAFPVHTGQIPVYYNELRTGRPYMKGSGEHFQSKYLDGPNAPLYPFGYGLSYSTFELKDLTLSQPVLHENEVLKVSVTLTNTGNRAAWETVQLYLSDRTASIVRPAKELKGFKKEYLEAGESREVVFEITEEMLRFYHADGSFAAEAGKFELMTGTSSRDEDMLKTSFQYE